ncbi:hypothetical protein GF376_03920 [Candidatus Peregrinibacteria bacterium]|nr:hypothetical protein [Candidatus Peregrinibacteria bacterium]
MTIDKLQKNFYDEYKLESHYPERQPETATSSINEIKNDTHSRKMEIIEDSEEKDSNKKTTSRTLKKTNEANQDEKPRMESLLPPISSRPPSIAASAKSRIKKKQQLELKKTELGKKLAQKILEGEDISEEQFLYIENYFIANQEALKIFGKNIMYHQISGNILTKSQNSLFNYYLNNVPGAYNEFAKMCQSAARSTQPEIPRNKKSIIPPEYNSSHDDETRPNKITNSNRHYPQED